MNHRYEFVIGLPSAALSSKGGEGDDNTLGSVISLIQWQVLSILAGITSVFCDLKQIVHAGQFKNLLHGRLGMEQADGAFASAGSLMQGD